MSEKCSLIVYKCKCCFYQTNKKYNLIRHQNAKHTCDIIYNNKLSINGENVHPKEENVTPKEENVTPKEENVTHNQEIVISGFICKKCNKTYKTKKFLLIHESKCNGLDDLTCPRCMMSFATRQSKSRHIINNKCKPRSIVYARKIINKKENGDNITNITINNINNVTNNYITVNNYGNERIDYLNYETMLEIFKKKYDIPTLLTKEIHFNKEFPENNNIQFKNENNALIKKENEFILKDLNTLVNELINEKTSQMQKFAIENKENICLKMDTHLYEDIIELLLNFILLKEPLGYYKNQIKNIKDIIKNKM